MTGGTAVPEEDKSLPTSSDTSGGAGEADTSHTARPRRHDRRSAAAKAGSVEGSAGAGVPVSPRGGPGEESDGEAEPEPGESAEKKARFMWTPEMHQRFEVAVHKLGVAQAKPQTIRQLMACEGEEDAPTRQNIKSHLQKYRQHRQTSLPTIAAARLASSAAPPSPAATEEARSRFELYQLNLLQQLELQANLHDQLLCQRRDQEALGCQLSHSASSSMHPNQLMRMAQHVVFQRHLLQHLFELLQAHTEDVMRDGTRVRATSTAKPRAHARRPSRPQ